MRACTLYFFSLLIFTACGSSRGGGDGSIGAVTAMPEHPDSLFEARTDHSLCLYNDKVYIWGGTGIDAVKNEIVSFDNGSVFDPEEKAWLELVNDDHTPSTRHLHGCVAGDILVQWGGRSQSGATLKTGAFYDSVSENWTTMSATGAHTQSLFHSMGLIGANVIFWGGGTTGVNSGAVYDTTDNTWSATSTSGAPSSRTYHSAVFTNTQMIIWGGRRSGNVVNTGAIYTPSSNTWQTISAVNAPLAREKHTAIWTGEEMIVWGGTAGGLFLNDGGVYDLATDSWTALPRTSLTGRTDHVAVWTGTYMFVWGGQSKGSHNDGILYDPVAEAWSGLSDLGLTPRIGHKAIWTGDTLVLWGGWDGPFSKYGTINDSKYRKNGVLIKF